jgi:hypothetical protein
MEKLTTENKVRIKALLINDMAFMTGKTLSQDFTTWTNEQWNMILEASKAVSGQVLESERKAEQIKPKPVKIKPEMCFNHSGYTRLITRGKNKGQKRIVRGRQGRYQFNLPRDNPLASKFFCKSCYREQLRNIEIPQSEIEPREAITEFTLSRVSPDQNPLVYNDNEIRNVLVGQYVRLSNIGTFETEITHNYDNGVTVLESCPECKGPLMACQISTCKRLRAEFGL